MRTHRTAMLAVFALLTCFAATSQAAEGDAVEGKGEAAITNGDKAAAKERATKAALRDAVERTLGTFVVSDSQTKDFQLVKDQILATSSGYVSKYDVIDEKEENGAMVVRVKAVVGQGRISEDLAAKGLAIRQMKFPRIAVLIAEQQIGQTAPSSWWSPQGGGQNQGQTIMVDQRIAENTFVGEWAPAGFTFVDMQALAGKLRESKVTSTPNEGQVKEVANLTDADVIIVGTAVASKQGDLGKLLDDKSGGVSMTSCKGSVTARIFNADSGEILATGEAGKTALHIDALVCGRKSLTEATKLLASDLQRKLLDAWNKRIGGASRIRMTVSKIDGFKILSELKQHLANVRGVQSIDQKSFKDGTADIDLRVDGGDTEALAGDLEARPLGKVKVRVTGVTANTISVEIAK